MRSVPSDPTEHLWTPCDLMALPTDTYFQMHCSMFRKASPFQLWTITDGASQLSDLTWEPEKAQNISGLSLDGSLDGTARVMELNQVGLNYPDYNQTTCIDFETF